jgi:hypothetical protein
MLPLKRREFITLLGGAVPGVHFAPSNSLIRSLDSEIYRRRFSTVFFDLVLNGLPFVERAQASTLNGRDMNKHVPTAAALRLNKSIAFGRIEPRMRIDLDLKRLDAFGDRVRCASLARRILSAFTQTPPTVRTSRSLS